MKLAKPTNDGQQNDWNTWCPGIEIGHVIASPLNPVVYSTLSASARNCIHEDQRTFMGTMRP
eukprot:scaffold2813_cov210-Prasinococcus_capsulatus_cf.AAC.3